MHAIMSRHPLQHPAPDLATDASLGSLAHKVVVDSNANAQAKALETLLVFLQRIADEDYVGKYGDAIVSAMSAKCLTQRPNTLKLVTECCIQIVELEGSEAVVVTSSHISLNYTYILTRWLIHASILNSINQIVYLVGGFGPMEEAFICATADARLNTGPIPVHARRTVALPWPTVALYSPCWRDVKPILAFLLRLWAQWWACARSKRASTRPVPALARPMQILGRCFHAQTQIAPGPNSHPLQRSL
eukprot:6786438-Pyramimonas_sp.AAC.1